MAKRTGLRESLSNKKTLPKKTPLKAGKIENAVSNIHEGKKKKNIRVSVDIPEDLYNQMKEKVREEGMTVRGYFLTLLKKDFQ